MRAVQVLPANTDTDYMRHRIHRALIPTALILVAAACTTPARTDTASLPPVATTSTVAPASTTLPPPTTTSTVAEQGPDIVAWLTTGAAEGTLAEAVSVWTGVGSVSVVSSEGALVEFATLFADRPDLVAGVEVAALPASLRIELSHPSYLADVASQLRALSDVADVTTAVTPICNPFSGWNVVLFVADDRELTRLRNELAATDDVTEVTVVGRDEAHAEYLVRFGGFSDLATLVTVQDMAVSLRAHSQNPVSLSLITRRFTNDPAVKGIQVFPPGAPACEL